MENEILSRRRLLPSSRKLYLGGWIATRWDIANKMSCRERGVMKWQGSTNISDVIACNNYSHEAAPSMLNKQKFFSWELQFVSESISRALKPGQRTIWELSASFLFKGWLYLNRFRLVGYFFIPVCPAWHLYCVIGKWHGEQVVVLHFMAAGFFGQGTRQSHSQKPLSLWSF